jgi:hypothetical protein
MPTSSMGPGSHISALYDEKLPDIPEDHVEKTQRWSMAFSVSLEKLPLPPSEADTESISTSASSIVSKRAREQTRIKGMMRSLFRRKDERSRSSSISSDGSKASKLSKTNSARVQLRQRKEGAGNNDIWKRLTIVVRPPKLEADVDETESVDSKESKEKDSKRDSKFSSATSLQSLGSFHHSTRTTPSSNTSTNTSPARAPNIRLLPSELENLRGLVNKAVGMLKVQEELTGSFSKNLAGLLWAKERGVQANKRLNEAVKGEMVKEVGRVRDMTARTFCRKSGFLERSMDTLTHLQELLDDAAPKQPSPEKDGRSSQYLEIRPSVTAARRKTRVSPLAQELGGLEEKKVEVLNLSLDDLNSVVATLKADLTAHSHLDPALRNTIVLPCQQLKYPTSDNDRVAMRRFVKFVDSRVKKLSEGYWEMGRWVREFDSAVDDIES